MSSFEFLEPTSVAEGVGLLQEHGGQVSIIAGGTDLLPRLNQQIRHPAFLLDLSGVPGLDRFEHVPGKGLQIGALTPVQVLEKSSLLERTFSALAEAAASVATPQVRNLGTIGGNICQDVRCWYLNQPQDWRESLAPCHKLGGEVCHLSKGGKRCTAISYSDTIPALVALEAEATIIGPKGKRTVPIADLASRGETSGLSREEILTEVRVPDPAAQSGSAYLRHNLRKAIDFPAVAVAAMVELDGTICRKARLALGAVVPAPYRVREAEEVLQGAELNKKAIAQAAHIVGDKARCLSDLYYTAEYKRHLVEVLVERALVTAGERAHRC
ncbi:MAG: xanthine dehydrogenase family protein subunit M [Chloroflexi bacterium]|nr:xanthine dehydrogenase family protein subunit M [Chloroflexota bacterium]